MNKSGPIVIIEDNKDDQEKFSIVFKELNYPNEIIFFDNGEFALHYLIATSDEPFIIISDINMPKLNGLALKERVYNNEKLRLKCIPYLFFTTSKAQKDVIDAYSKSAQGFFIKPADVEKLKSMMRKIIEYWLECESPNYIQ